MARKTKTYLLVKFPIEIIQSAIDKFKSFFDAKTVKSLSYSWEIQNSDSSWQFDNSDEFIFEYKKQELIDARIVVTNPLYQRLSLHYDGHILARPDTTISIDLSDREEIESIFRIFESFYLDFLQAQENHNSENAVRGGSGEVNDNIGFPHYKETNKTPSIYIDRDLLVDLEKYILTQAKQYSKQTKGLVSNYHVYLSDSSGDYNYKSIASYTRDFFDNKIKSIFLIYGDYSTDLRISLDFSKDIDLSTLSIEYTGDNARDIVDNIRMGILRILNESKTWNFLYYPHIFYKGILVGLPLFLLEIAALNKSLLLLKYVFATFLLVLTYLIGPVIKPYITFRTKRNISLQKINKWLIETILAILLTWIVTNLLVIIFHS